MKEILDNINNRDIDGTLWRLTLTVMLHSLANDTVLWDERWSSRSSSCKSNFRMYLKKKKKNKEKEHHLLLVVGGVYFHGHIPQFLLSAPQNLRHWFCSLGCCAVMSLDSMCNPNSEAGITCWKAILTLGCPTLHPELLGFVFHFNWFSCAARKCVCSLSIHFSIK